ncbi:Oidioi.mRNA.OKI2018_I69.XSR.g13266.t1.cds [Oikopleura dioica]|uniref:Oidioi.mRNA.OKI2018_I69.XSR.g13266.t1.cds n=1 Tax=Oikopleura dioica TaxID=34765 RepID=A0ABN7S6V3_OIKDI|nr:Oidioi.mRNA.OKI2018_I69.XSR.g13266.t1.cds [Oikopleura dioica]
MERSNRTTSYVLADDKREAKQVIDVDRLEPKYAALIERCRAIEGCYIENLKCCHKIFQNLRNFGVHITKIHRSMEDDVKAGKTFACHICEGRTYRSTFALQRHLRETHRSMDHNSIRRAVERAKIAQENGIALNERHWRQNHLESDYNVMLSTETCDVCESKHPDPRTLATHMARTHKDYWIFDAFGRHKDNPNFEAPSFEENENIEENFVIPRKSDRKSKKSLSQENISSLRKLQISNGQKQNQNQSNSVKNEVEIVKFDFDGVEGEDESEEIEEIDTSLSNQEEKLLSGDEIGTNMNGTLIRTCSLCKTRFNDAPQYREHMKAEHSDVNWEKMPQFECPDCGKMFSQHSNMRRHHRIHTGESLFDCNICGRGFIQKVALQYHLTTVHSGDSNECKICGKFFKDAQDLKTHIRVHTGRKAGSFVKEIGKSKAAKKEREQKKESKSAEATNGSPQLITNSRKRKRRSEIEHVHDDEEEEETPKTYSCPICTRNVEFSRREFLDQHLLHHEDCLAILQRKRPRRPEVERANHEKMMEELYKNCPFKMKRSKTMSSILNESEEDELLEPAPKQERVRLIPREFSCKRIEGTNCTFTSRVEAIFREHILTHVTEKLKKEGLLDNN